MEGPDPRTSSSTSSIPPQTHYGMIPQPPHETSHRWIPSPPPSPPPGIAVPQGGGTGVGIMLPSGGREYDHHHQQQSMVSGYRFECPPPPPPPYQWWDRRPSQQHWLPEQCGPASTDMRLVEMAAPLQAYPGPVSGGPSMPHSLYGDSSLSPFGAVHHQQGASPMEESSMPEWWEQSEDYSCSQAWAPGSNAYSPPPPPPDYFDPWSSPRSHMPSPVVSYSTSAGYPPPPPHDNNNNNENVYLTSNSSSDVNQVSLSPTMNPLVYETPAPSYLSAHQYVPPPPHHQQQPGSARLGLPRLPLGATLPVDYHPAPHEKDSECYDKLKVESGGQFPFDDFLALTDEEVRSYAEDHVTSLYLQDALRAEFRNASQVSRVVDRLVPAFLPLSFHSIGNYVSQAVLEVSDMATFEQLLNTQILKGRALFDLCVHPHGTRVVQKLISEANVRYGGSNQLPLLGAIRVCCRELAVDSNGCYVLLKASRCDAGSFPSCVFQILDVMAQSGWLLECLLDRFIDISCSQWGVITAKKVIERCPAIDRVEADPDMQQHYPNGSGWTEHPVIVGRHTTRLLEIFVADFVSMSRHQYGNYAVQHILQSPAVSGSTAGCKALGEVSRVLSRSIITLSKDKYSSNCVELLLVRGPSTFARNLAKDLLSGRRIEELLWDTYGNYVLQKLLIVTKNRGLPEFGDLVKSLKPFIHTMLRNKSAAGGSNDNSNSTAGRNYRVAKKLVAKFPELHEGFSKTRSAKMDMVIHGIGSPDGRDASHYSGGFTATSTPSWEASCKTEGITSPTPIKTVLKDAVEDKGVEESTE
ncbi:pumilio domain member 4 [Perkinsus chesapeaki]|uniref:Pumilio domain member 4 n=1 Tax=Perkinsus chesapeaki TaxID=330153 RepID=A0A7J6MYK6_PERCH|nr:pumilio domain member 4 [Perkinsus chesapeaki]